MESEWWCAAGVRLWSSRADLDYSEERFLLTDDGNRANEWNR
jgi:hypothetical protein